MRQLAPFSSQYIGSIFPIDRHYETFDLFVGGRKGSRRIKAPREPLKGIQRQILHNLLYLVEPHHSATAYFPGRSIVDNATPHLHCRVMFKCDIENFFDSISRSHVNIVLGKYFSSLDSKTRELLSDVLTLDDQLPMGAPSSPHLANLVLRELDSEVSQFCSERASTYTRYADDICVSGSMRQSLTECEYLLRQRLGMMGFRLNPRKTEYSSPNQRKVVTGLDVTDGSIRPPRRFRKKVAAMLRVFEAHNSAHLRGGEYLKGHIAFWHSISPEDPELDSIKKRLAKLPLSWS